MYSIGFKNKAENIFKKIDDDSDWELKLLLARLNIYMGEHNRTLKYLNEAIKLVESRKMRKILLEEKIGVLFNLEKYNEAVTVLKIEEQDISNLEMMGNIYLKMEDWNLAEECAKKVIDVECNNENALYILAGIYYKRKEYKKSINYCKKILEHNYDEEGALGCLVNSHLELDNLKMAEKYFKKLRSKYSGQMTTIFIHAKLQYKKGNIKKAYKILKFIKKQKFECNKEFHDLYNKVEKKMRD